MLKAFIFGVLIGALAILGGVYFYFTSGRAPVAAADRPIPFEQRLADAALQAHLSREPHSNPPVAADETTYLGAAVVYRQNCAACHGQPEQPASPFAQGMYPPPPQLFRGVGVTDDPIWETYWKAKNGIRLSGMPAFKNSLTDRQLWQVSQMLANADKLSPAVLSALKNDK